MPFVFLQHTGDGTSESKIWCSVMEGQLAVVCIMPIVYLYHISTAKKWMHMAVLLLLVVLVVVVVVLVVVARGCGGW